MNEIKKVKRKVKGSAIILGVIAVAIVASVIAKINFNTSKQVRIVETTIERAQINEFLLSGEAWAEQKLNSNEVSIDRDRGYDITVFPLDEGEIEIRLVDLQTCLNVNALANEDSKEVTEATLKTLSTKLGIDPVWIDVAKDWVDKDGDVSINGAESDRYLANLVPYNAANQNIVGDYEWNMLDIDEDSLEKLVPYICATPIKTSQINLNNASDIVIQSALPTITNAQLDRLNILIKKGFVYDLESLRTDPLLDVIEWDENDWTTSSNVVSVLVKLKRQDKVYWLHAELAKGTNGQAKAYFRSYIKPNLVVQKRFGIKESSL